MLLFTLSAAQTNFMSRSESLHEAQRRGVHAVAQSCGVWAVVEDVAQMRITLGAGYCGAYETESCVANFCNVFFCDHLPEAGPSRTGFEFCGGVEKCIVA